ncbi:hypothetical protein, partial [Vreelandella rituensis]|uniref:hypothetical protein n=1 Tax=Vreelandella rituensis TaxID=2282306 RepID=UPI001C69E3C0
FIQNRFRKTLLLESLALIFGDIVTLIGKRPHELPDQLLKSVSCCCAAAASRCAYNTRYKAEVNHYARFSIVDA